MTLSYDEAGEGPPVVLLHSSVCDRRMWDAQFRSLAAAGHRVVRCDFRGYGATPVADRPYADAGDVLGLMDALGVERAALVGSSFGGRVALLAAAAAPERVSALALLCAAPLPGQEQSAELAAFDAREDALFETRDLAGAAALNVATWLGPDADEAARGAVYEMQLHAFEVQTAAEEAVETEGAPHVLSGGRVTGLPDFSAFASPCLAVSGAHDLPDFRRAAARVPALLPNARHLELPWAGHLPSLERPGETGALLTGFLAGAALPAAVNAA
ncbi:alpha/beta fold hydrolase [Streptomyces peucetius]|uniref:Alpha/beta hydrolase n=1 Tax=Streptomyces peucetius TaxID=1950 RepID=A0ABY6IAD0_STRPE|nr:alpha/beta hydrolase [Streptomyces peucetius]UYQ63972.1 alpha/beta hydrolase [Streptomyces peucetius]